MTRVVAEQQTNTCPQGISKQQTNSSLMAVLQRTVMSRVVTNRRRCLTLQATSAQRTNSGLMTMLQWMTMPKVVIGDKWTQAQLPKALAHVGSIP